MGQQFKVGDRVRLERPDEDDRNAGLSNDQPGTIAALGNQCVAVSFDGCDVARWMYPSQLSPTPTAESLLLALGTASRELEDAITAERDANAAAAAAATRRAQASEAHAEALKAVREAAWARAA